MKKVYIETLGCMKNQYDSEVAASNLEARDYEIVDNPEDADILMVNTCGFIDDAKRESIDAILSMAEYKNQGKKVAVTGCLSKRYGKELMKEMPEVDVFVGVNEYDVLPEIFDGLYSDGDKAEEKLFAGPCHEKALPKENRKIGENPYSVPLKISEGCNNACAYCIIPKIRGRYRSKTMEDIVSEAKELANKGTKELILIAQDLTYYGIDLYGKPVLHLLLKELVKIKGIRWIRLMYCYEERITDELIKVIKEEEKICKYIDIPMQHASNKILKSMYRHTTKESMMNTVNKLRREIPDIAIRTTFIVGFPGETEEDFNELAEFVEEMKFDRMGAFVYSKEEGTAAYDRPGHIAEDIKESRRDELMQIQIDIARENNLSRIGKVLDVVVDFIEEDEYTDKVSYIGRTQYDAPDIDNEVIFQSERRLQIGDMVKVKIEDAFDYDLTGTEVL